MLKILPLVLLFLPLRAFSAGDDISAKNLLIRMAAERPPVILDVRSPEEYASGHVPGAINIPHDQIQARLSELDDQRGEEIVVYCRSGKRAGIASEILSDSGFRVTHLTGDMMGWTAAGHPEENDHPRSEETY